MKQRIRLSARQLCSLVRIDNPIHSLKISRSVGFKFMKIRTRTRAVGTAVDIQPFFFQALNFLLGIVQRNATTYVHSDET